MTFEQWYAAHESELRSAVTGLVAEIMAEVKDGARNVWDAAQAQCAARLNVVSAEPAPNSDYAPCPRFENGAWCFIHKSIGACCDKPCLLAMKRDHGA